MLCKNYGIDAFYLLFRTMEREKTKQKQLQSFIQSQNNMVRAITICREPFEVQWKEQGDKPLMSME